MIPMALGQFPVHDKSPSRHQSLYHHSQAFVQPLWNWQMAQKIMGEFMDQNVLSGEVVNEWQRYVRIGIKYSCGQSRWAT
jgi:hypothetical protein